MNNDDTFEWTTPVNDFMLSGVKTDGGDYMPILMDTDGLIKVERTVHDKLDEILRRLEAVESLVDRAGDGAL